MCLTGRIQFLHPSQCFSFKKSKHSMSTKRQPYCTNHNDRKYIHKARMLRIANFKRDVLLINQYDTEPNEGGRVSVPNRDCLPVPFIKFSKEYSIIQTWSGWHNEESGALLTPGSEILNRFPGSRVKRAIILSESA
jgi:hypothetical protein